MLLYKKANCSESFGDVPEAFVNGNQIDLQKSIDATMIAIDKLL
jgi:hypothetical protein